MRYCTICMKKIFDEKNNLCKSCNKKKEVAKIILELSNDVDFKEPFSKKTLLNVGITNKVRINHYIWSLEECNIIHKEKNHYIWEDENNIVKFIEKFYEEKSDEVKNNLNIKKSNMPKCERCGEDIKNSKKKTKYCKNCKKINKTIKNISKIENLAQTKPSFTLEELINETGIEQWKIEGIIWDLQENDLVQLNDSEEYVFILDKINEFKENNKISPKKIDENTPQEITNNNKENNIDINSKEIKTIHTPETTITEEIKENKFKSVNDKTISDNKVENHIIQDNIINTKEEEDTKIIQEEPISRIARHIYKINPEVSLSDNSKNNDDSTENTKLENNKEEHISDERLDEIINNYYNKNKEIDAAEDISELDNNYEEVKNPVLNNEKENRNLEDIEKITDENIKKQPISRMTKHINKIKSEINKNSNKENITNKNFIKIDLNNENVLIDFITKLQEYIKNYIEVLSRSVKNTDITSDEILINFNSFLNDKYNEEIIENKKFSKYFTSELFKIYPNAYRSFTKNELNEEIIHYNIKIKYENDILNSNVIKIKETNISKNISPELNLNNNYVSKEIKEKKHSIDETNQIIREYIDNNLIILDREPFTTDLTFHEIYDNFYLYCELNNYQVNQNTFSKMFKEYAEEYGIKRTLYLGKIRYNVEFNKKIIEEPNTIDIKLRPIDKISNEERENHIQKSLEKNKKTKTEIIEQKSPEISIEDISKIIPPKIFTAKYDEKSLIFIKTRIKQDTFEKLLVLINNTKDKINNFSIHKLHDNKIDVSIEYIVDIQEKEEFVKLIQKYSWD